MNASDIDRAAAEIAADPEILAEVAAAIPALKIAAITPAGRAGVMEVVGQSFAHYPQPEREDGEWEAFWGPYVALCGTIPMEALQSAMLSHMRGPKGEFLPKPGELSRIAMTSPTSAARAHAIASRAVQIAHIGDAQARGIRHVSAPAMRPVVTPQDRANVRAWAADFSRHVREQVALDEKRREPPAIQAPVNERGISPEMQARLMDQRRAEQERLDHR